ncbi:peptidase family M48-domain-containing protein [Jimgerdemannia flammicorona]|uniref:Peptidase family M48-domain-containing protein n=1 Tax=Jimgerdemannia flammicorona TaxID=994334 RepID=A0A433A2N5_9FUNG|nr:peptidase family M48-domain-containing protein [Jimgerdemannia flammicorona]
MDLRTQTATRALSTGAKLVHTQTVRSMAIESHLSRPIACRPSSALIPTPMVQSRILTVSQALQYQSRRQIHNAIETASTTIPVPELFVPLLPSLFLVFPIFVLYIGAVQLALPHITTLQSSPTQLRLLRQLPRCIIPLTFLGTGLIAIIAYDEAPTTHRPRLLLLRRWEEHRLAAAAKTCVNQLTMDPHNALVPTDDDRHRMVQAICDRLWRAACDLHAERQQTTSPRIVLLDADHELDAVSYPCGAITLTTGWLRTVDYDQPMLAAVLAHEIAHMVQRHAVELFGVSMLVSVVQRGLETVENGLRSIILGGGRAHADNESHHDGDSVLVGTPTAFLGGFSRRLEKEADLIGQHILARAGYDPESAVDLWATMMIANERENGELEKEEPVADLMAARGHHRMWHDSRHGDGAGSHMHPPRAERAWYLRENLENLRGVYERVVRERGGAETIRPDFKIIRGMAIMSALYATLD